MSKITVLVLGVIAAVVALLLFVFGRRKLYVDAGARRTLRGRFLLAVAFFLAVFGGVVDRAKGAEKPAAATAQQLSLAEMQKAVEAILRSGPPGNDWWDPAIQPNIVTLLEKSGLIASGPRVTCYDRAAVPVKERSEELAALQKRLLDEKIAAGIIPQEVGGKITAIPEPKPGTPKEVRAYQKKVRRVARLVYKAGELDSGTVKKLEAAVGMPIVKLDPARALKADVTYALQGRAPWRWPADVRKEYLAMLAKQGVINKVKTRRGEMKVFCQRDPKQVEAARATIKKVAKLLADPKHSPTLAQDKGKTVEMPLAVYVVIHRPDVLKKASPEVRLLVARWRTRRAVRILIADGIVRAGDAAHFSKWLGIPVFGTIKVERPPQMCYRRTGSMPRGPRLSPAERREMRRELREADALSEQTVAKLEGTDERRL